MDFSFLSDPQYDVLAAFWMNVQLTFWSAIGSLILGTLLAAMRVSPVPLMRGFATVYVNVVRNIPLTVIIIMMAQVLYTQLGLRLAVRTPGEHPQIFLDAQNFRLAVLGFILYTSTFVAEAIRSGINTVPAGQAEAARAIGLRFSQVLGIVVMPQAFRAVIAPLASVLIALTKNTSVAGGFFVVELFATTRQLANDNGNIVLQILFTAAALYLVITIPLGYFAGQLEKRWVVRR